MSSSVSWPASRGQTVRLHPVPHETGSHDERGDRLDMCAARWRQPERVHKGPHQLRLHLVPKDFGGLRPTARSSTMLRAAAG
jgi:hypothetical protein